VPERTDEDEGNNEKRMDEQTVSSLSNADTLENTGALGGQMPVLLPEVRYNTSPEYHGVC